MNNDFITQARKFAAKGMNKCNGTAISADDVFVVWFCKPLQNWKAIVSTFAFNGCDYVEVPHNGDRNETYVDVYDKQMNICFKGETDVRYRPKNINVESEEMK